MNPHPLITLLTDFGIRDAFAGVMKGVILGINPAATVVDLSHEVQPQDVLAGALILRSAAPFFPAGAIHVAVVDPGVGSERRAVLVETLQHVFIGPDNGLLSLAAPPDAVRRIIHLSNDRYFLPQPSSTFHGRDIFAPVAAHVSRGVPTADLGPYVGAMDQLYLPPVERGETELSGCVMYIDHFGNLTTNITAADLLPFRKHPLWVSITPVRIQNLVPTYAAVAMHAPAALINSWGFLEIAVRNGSAAQQLGAGVGCRVSVARV